MALHALTIGSPGKLWGLVYDDGRSLLNVFFKDEFGLGGLSNDLGTDVPDVNEPADAKEHIQYHGRLADELDSGGADAELVKMVRDADGRHGHMKLPTGSNDRESAVGILFMKKWIDKSAMRSLARLI